MPGYLNKVSLIGNLGRDPEVKATQSGDTFVIFSMATSELWNDKNSGEKRKNTEWHKVVVFGNLADICARYLKKGSLVYVEGKLRTRKWEDDDGNTKSTTEVLANNMQMLDKVDSTESNEQRPTEYDNSNNNYNVPNNTAFPPPMG